MAPRPAGHRTLPHTADVILEAWGPDVSSCCEQAVAALVDTYVAAGGGAVVAERRFRVAPGPAEDAVLAVLDEVIFVLDTADAVPVAAEVRPGGGGLDVVLRLADRGSVEPTGAVPKAVSRSGLAVDAAPGRVSCRFLVDV